MKKISLVISLDKISGIEETKPEKLSKNTIISVIELFKRQSQGLALAQQREALKILDAIEYAQKILELEDSEYAFLKNIFGNVKWPLDTRIFLRVYENIENPIKEKLKSNLKSK